MIVFDPLWKTMKRKGISQYKLINQYGISPGQLSRFKQNCNISTHTINVLCEILECEVSDIMEFKSTKEAPEEPTTDSPESC